MGDNQLLLEAMALDNMGVEGSKNGATQKLESYTKPPTLERIRDEVPSSTDVLGGRVAFSMPFRESGMSLTLNAMARLNNRKVINKLWEWHGYGVFEFKSSELRQRLKPRLAIDEITLRSRNSFRKRWHTPISISDKASVIAWSFVSRLIQNTVLALEDPTVLEWYIRGSTYLG